MCLVLNLNGMLRRPRLLFDLHMFRTNVVSACTGICVCEDKLWPLEALDNGFAMSVRLVLESQRVALAAASNTRPGPEQNARQFTYVYTYV